MESKFVLEVLMDSRLNKTSAVPLTKRLMVFCDALHKILALVKRDDPSSLLSSSEVTVDYCVLFWAHQYKRGIDILQSPAKGQKDD